MLLAERLRKPEEKRVIKEVLEKNMKNVTINEEEIYSRPFNKLTPKKNSCKANRSTNTSDDTEGDAFLSNLLLTGHNDSMVWNKSMQR